jgi:hypothetical protein
MNHAQESLASESRVPHRLLMRFMPAVLHKGLTSALRTVDSAGAATGPRADLTMTGQNLRIQLIETCRPFPGGALFLALRAACRPIFGRRPVRGGHWPMELAF